MAGIHYGLKNQCEPGTMIPEKADIEYSTTLPVRWSHALNAFEAGNVLPAYFGNEYHHVFSICRRDEESRFHSEVSNLDYQWYLRSI